MDHFAIYEGKNSHGEEKITTELLFEVGDQNNPEGWPTVRTRRNDGTYVQCICVPLRAIKALIHSSAIGREAVEKTGEFMETEPFFGHEGDVMGPVILDNINKRDPSVYEEIENVKIKDIFSEK